MNKKILLQASAGLGAVLWLVLSGCGGMGGGSGCGGTGGSPTGCTGSAPPCASGFVSQCQTNSNDGSTSWVCVQK